MLKPQFPTNKDRVILRDAIIYGVCFSHFMSTAAHTRIYRNIVFMYSMPSLRYVSSST